MDALAQCILARRPLLKWERLRSLQAAAVAAQHAADRNDSKKVFSIARSLGGRPLAPLKSIAHETGSILSDDGQTRDRWRRHFSELFKAEVVEDVGMLVTNAQQCDSSSFEMYFHRQSRRRTKEKPVDPSVEVVYKAVMSLNGGRGLGRDVLSASILQAGGWLVAGISVRFYR